MFITDKDKMNTFNYELAEMLSKNKKIISFDIYDTLVKRNVPNPRDVFELVEYKYKKMHGIDLKFKDIRINAEREVRKENIGYEITFDAIYEHINLPNRNDLKSIEIAIEEEICEPNYPVIKFFNQCISNGKRVIIITDMYFPELIIRKILKKCNISKFEKLYISSEVGVEKRTGKLFEYVLKDLDIKPNQMIHFGDRRKTDNIIPRLKGISSFYISPNIQNTEQIICRDNIPQSMTHRFISNNLYKYNNNSDLFKWGYEAFGPLLLGFCMWVHKKVVENNIERVFFLARDMNLVEQIYRKIYGEENIYYLEVSRRSLRSAYIVASGNFNRIFDHMPRKKYLLIELLNTLSIEWKEICEFAIIEKYSINAHTQIDPCSLPVWFNELGNMALDILKNKTSLTLQYLQQYSLFDDKRDALVDIGWHGTTQNALEKICRKSFMGFYFGNTKRKNFNKMNMSGYWFDYDKEEDALPYLAIVNILEAMLFPQIGTTIGYRQEETYISPIYNKCEMKDFSKINQFQQGAMTFIKDYLSSPLREVYIEPNDAVAAYKRLAYKPTLKQAKLLADLPYEEEKNYCMAKVQKKGEYIKNPVQFFKDYGNAKWKEGFIKQICPLIHNPYRIDLAIKKRRHKKI